MYIIPNPYDRDGFNRACIWDAEQTKVEYNDRKEVIMWRGAGHGIDKKHIFFDLIRNETYYTTTATATTNKERFCWLNASNIDEYPDTRLERSIMAEYKYQLDISGDIVPAWGGMRWKMCTGNVVFRVNTTLMDWWYSALVPYKHYVPVDSDLSNLYQQYQWVQQHRYEAYNIMKAGQELCKQTSTEEAITKYQSSIILSIPSASYDAIVEANTLLNDAVTKSSSSTSIWKKVEITNETIYDRNKKDYS